MVMMLWILSVLFAAMPVGARGTTSDSSRWCIGWRYADPPRSISIAHSSGSPDSASAEVASSLRRGFSAVGSQAEPAGETPTTNATPGAPEPPGVFVTMTPETTAPSVFKAITETPSSTPSHTPTGTSTPSWKWTPEREIADELASPVASTPTPKLKIPTREGRWPPTDTPAIATPSIDYLTRAKNSIKDTVREQFFGSEMDRLNQEVDRLNRDITRIVEMMAESEAEIARLTKLVEEYRRQVDASRQDADLGRIHDACGTLGEAVGRQVDVLTEIQLVPAYPQPAMTVGEYAPARWQVSETAVRSAAEQSQVDLQLATEILNQVANEDHWALVQNVEAVANNVESQTIAITGVADGLGKLDETYKGVESKTTIVSVILAVFTAAAMMAAAVVGGVSGVVGTAILKRVVRR